MSDNGKSLAIYSQQQRIKELEKENARLERLNQEQYEMLKEVSSSAELVRSKSSSSLVRRGVSLPSEPRYYKLPLHLVSVINTYVNGLKAGGDHE